MAGGCGAFTLLLLLFVLCSCTGAARGVWGDTRGSHPKGQLGTTAPQPRHPWGADGGLSGFWGEFHAEAHLTLSGVPKLWAPLV